MRLAERRALHRRRGARQIYALIANDTLECGHEMPSRVVRNTLRLRTCGVLKLPPAEALKAALFLLSQVLFVSLLTACYASGSPSCWLPIIQLACITCLSQPRISLTMADGTAQPLLIGGIDLTSPYNDCTSIFDGLASGHDHGTQYAEAALKLTLLSHRLIRWASARRQVEAESTQEEGEAVKAALEGLLQFLHERKAPADHQHSPRESPSAESLAIVQVTEAVRKAMPSESAHSGTVDAESTSWILSIVADVDSDIELMTGIVSGLEILSHDVLSKPLWDAREALALRFAQLVATQETSANDKDNNESLPLPGNATTIFQNAAAIVDPQLKDAIATRSHSYGNVAAEDTATVRLGDYVAEGHAVRGHGHKYENIGAKGQAKMLAGNQYGGKSIFDD